MKLFTLIVEETILIVIVFTKHSGVEAKTSSAQVESKQTFKTILHMFDAKFKGGL